MTGDATATSADLSAPTRWRPEMGNTNSDSDSDAEPDSIKGKKIVDVREMTEDELEREGWHKRHGRGPTVLELETGMLLYPSCDPEGNAPGALFGIDADDNTVYIHP